VLLQEIHHRVKNNLQVISSLLSLQARGMEHPGAREALRESENRVRSMALVHEALYKSEHLARIDVGRYLRDLGRALVESYSTGGRVELLVEAEEMAMSVDAAVSCGLIVHELVSNSLKYAFPEGRTGEIRIGVTPSSDASLTLSVKDDGAGFPEHLDFRDSPSLGLQLVGALAAQMGGSVELHREGGTEFRVSVKT